MKFKIDENISASAKSLLLERGHDCHPVYDEGIEGGADDDLINICLREQRHLITLDLDSADIIRYAPIDYHGVIVLRLTRQDAFHVIDRLGEALSEIEELSLRGHLVIVDDRRIRFR
ncbi:DUF5615 family PIN-like protein [Haloferula sp. A504]|uniref:DUF5615 family PIN-like protein n=1 Tax=Haloferula sp. A504 TaxID=3373601 RepID=UPI0031BEF120|nr:DUF5615 family PIN-like protein [Verrucomicrobiaceae bacterium E54]